MKRLHLITLLLVAALAFAACGGPKPEAVEEAPPAEEAVEEAPAEEVEEEAPEAEEAEEEAPAAETGPVEGGILHYAVAGVVQFDPPLIVDTSHVVAWQVFSYLYRTGDDGEVIPDLATSWDIEDDGTTIIFHLREGVYYHDDNEVFPKGESREVVASDVVYAIERSVNLEENNTPFDFLNSYESVEALDDYTVALHLTSPNALLFTYGAGFPVYPQEAVEQLGEAWPHNPIGSGPFKMASFTPDDSVVLERNELYRIRPNLDGITFHIIPDEDAMMIALEAGEIQWTWLPAAQYASFADNSDYFIYQEICPGSYQMQLDMNHAALQDKAVREALAHAIDGEAILQALMPGEYVPGLGVAGPGRAGFDEGLADRYFTYDPALTEELMTNAGWEKNTDGVWAKDGETLSLEMELWNMDPMPLVGAAVLTQLQEAGFDASLNTVEFGTWIGDYTGGEPKPVMFWSGFCEPAAMSSLYGAGGLGTLMGYENEEVFALVDASNAMMDPAERNETLLNVSDLIFADYPAIPLGFTNTMIIASAKIHDYALQNSLQNVVTEYHNVWLDQ
ncbi:MAG: ABC transporter substrate-binding protein [Chloroflexota bacterium]